MRRQFLARHAQQHEGAGSVPGTLIRKVGQKPLESVKEYNAAISAALEADGSVLLLIQQKGVSRFVVLRPAGD
jgi:hypothetical protein